MLILGIVIGPDKLFESIIKLLLTRVPSFSNKPLNLNPSVPLMSSSVAVFVSLG